MKVKAIKDYNDLELKRLVKADEELTVKEARGKVLIKAGVAVEVVEPTEVVEEPPKKKTKKEGSK